MKKTSISFLTFLVFGILFLAGTAVQIGFSLLQPAENHYKNSDDVFDESLKKLNNMNKLIAFVDSIALEKDLTTGKGLYYPELVDSIVRMRFFHGLQNYTIGENYIANLAGTYFWGHLKAKVIPNHILKGQNAYCSQSSIIFQEVLRNKGYSIRTVELPNHFCTEVLIDDDWKFFDVSYKPNFNVVPRLSTAELMRNPGLLEKAYSYSFRKDFYNNIQEYFNPSIVSYGSVNVFAAPRMVVFHQVTWFFSWFGWAVFLGLGVFAWWVAKRSSIKAS